MGRAGGVGGGGGQRETRRGETREGGEGEWKEAYLSWVLVLQVFLTMCLNDEMRFR